MLCVPCQNTMIFRGTMSTFRSFHLQVHDQRCRCEGSRPRGDCPKKITLLGCILSRYGYITFFSTAGALAVVTATSISDDFLDALASLKTMLDIK